MAAATDETTIDWIELWKNEALVLAGNEQAAESLVRRIYEAGQADRRTRDADTISALEHELARLRRSTTTAGS